MLDLWSKVSEVSRRYSTSTGDSEHAGLEESLGANLTDMRRFEERAALSRQESESWSEQVARVRSEAQAIDRELGQPFFVWLSERTGTASAIRIASPQTPEDAEVPRSHAASFVAERFPAPAGPDSASVGGEAEYGAARDTLAEAYARETAAAHAGWAEGVRDRAYVADAPLPGEVAAKALGARAETAADMTVTEAARDARSATAREDARDGRAGVAAETEKPLAHHATQSAPVIGEWLAGKLFGTAENTAPDEGEHRLVETEPGEAEDAEPVPRDSAMAVVVAEPVLVVAEPLVAAGARGPLVVLASVLGEPVAAEGGPVAVPETAHQRAREACQHRPGERRQPQRRDEAGLRAKRGRHRRNSDGAEHDEARRPGVAAALWSCGYRGHGGGLRQAGAGGAALSARTRLARAPLGSASPRRGAGPCRTGDPTAAFQRTG